MSVKGGATLPRHVVARFAVLEDDEDTELEEDSRLLVWSPTHRYFRKLRTSRSVDI